MILVTGATGLLGVHLLMELCEKEQLHIKAIYRTQAKKNEAQQVFLNFNPYSNAAEKWRRIVWVNADITTIPSLELAFKDVSQVYHCAGYVSFNTKKFDLLKKINIEGTANVVNLALSYNVSKFCHVSSIATLNINLGEDSFNENSQWNTEANNSGYAISKFGGEMEVWRGIQEGLNAVIVNPGVIIGSGFFTKGSSKLFSTVNNGIPFYTPGGTGYVSVIDCVKIMQTLMNKSVFNERFIIVGKNTTHKKVIDSIANYLNINAPKKQIHKKWVTLLAKTEYALSLISNFKPSIPLDIIDGLFEVSVYENKKIKNTLNWHFEDLEKTLKKVALDYHSSSNGTSPSFKSTS